jgi:hypothetical protein
MVVDVLIDGEGRPRAAVIDFGGFLGVGSRKVAVHWEALDFLVGDRAAPLILKLDKADVQAAPEFKPTSQPAELVAPAAPDEKSAEPPAIASPASQVPDAATDQPPAAAQPEETAAPPSPAPAPKVPHACCEQPPAAAQPKRQPIAPNGPPAPDAGR